MAGKIKQTQQNHETQQRPPVKSTQHDPLAFQDLEALALQRAMADPVLAQPADILALQRIAGNRAVTGLIQAKLTVGGADDQYEQEADRVADQVMQRGVQAEPAAQRQEEEELQLKPLVQLQEEEEELQMKPLVQLQEEEEEIQTKSSLRGNADDSFEAGRAFEDRLAAQKGSGSPLPDETRSFMENRFGADFSGVRVHTGGEAVQLNRDLSAQAFTHGQDIYMGGGKFSPDTEAGKRLLAHELTHVVQQGGAQAQGNTASTARIQRALDFNGTNWSDTNQIVWVKGQDHPDHDNVLNFKGGGGSRLWVKTDESVAEAQAAAGLVAGAAQVRAGKPGAAAAWKLSTPQIRAASVADRTAMVGKLGKLKPSAAKAKKRQLERTLLTSPEVHISTHAGGEMGDKPVAEAQEPWIRDPGFRKALGYTGFLDLVMANFDRIMGMVGPQNWKVERPNATLHLIDNLYRAGGFNMPFEEWSHNNWIAMARARNWAGIKTQLLGYWETDPQFQLIPTAQRGPWADDFMAGMQEAYGDLDAVRHALEAGGPPDEKRAILLQRISYLRGWVAAGPRIPKWKAARPHGGG